MDDAPGPELRTPRLLLRPWRTADVDDVFVYARDEEWGRYLPVPRPYTYRDAEAFVAQAILADWHRNAVLAVEHEGRAVGGVSLRMDREALVGEMGWSIARWLWGRGLATEAAQAVATWGFEEHGLARIYATADVRNAASWRVMEKLGMEPEGVMRGHIIRHGERSDQIVYGMLRDDVSPSGR